MKKIDYVFWGLMVLIAAIASCANTGEETIEMEEGPPQRSGGSSSASWAFAYDSIEDMCAHSDYIIVGTAESINEIVDEHPMYTTYWNFKIDSVLKGENIKEIIVG